jgi:RNA polymerase sigma-70 factor (ECF subfamily)
MSSEFHTTHWSVVLTAKGDDTAAKAALATLCETYYQPVLRYIERSIHADAVQRYGGCDARDLTHDFFATLLEGEMFSNLQRERGRFRAYLLGAVKHFLSVIRKHVQANKRGGDVVHVAFPVYSGEIAITELDYDALFDRDWAQAIIDRALQQFKDMPETQSLLPWLSRELTADDRMALSASLGMSDTAIKVAVHRFRKKFRELVKGFIAETVEHPSEIDFEITRLIKALNT